MNKENNIRKLLNRPTPARTLQEKLINNWREQRQMEKANNKKPLWFAAASLLVVVMITSQIDGTPDIVYAALDDINADERHAVEHVIDLQKLQNDLNIQANLSAIPLEMSKYCLLNNAQAAHLKLMDENLGEIHYFLRQGEFEYSIWQAQSGELNTKPWTLMQSHNDFSLLVIYGEKTDQDAIEQYTRKLFFS